MDKQMQAFALGGLKDEGGEIDEASGNRVPIGGTKEGVRDDIPANVSEGEFIFPADVVRYHGLDKMMALRQEAKMGLKQMERMGQMGNSDEATMPDDLPFGMADLIVVGGEGEPMEFAEGGFVPQMQTLQTAPVPTMGGGTSTGTQTPIVYDDFMKTPVVTMQEYRDANGNSIIITSVNGKATTEIPAGYTLYTPPANTAPTTTQAAIQTVNRRSYRPTTGDNEGPEPQPDQPAPDYRNMNDDEFFSYMAEQNGFGAKAGNAAGLAIATMIGGPVGLLVSALMRNNKNNQMANMKSRIDNMPNGPAKTSALAAYKEYGGETDPKKKEGLFTNIANFVTGLVTPVANALGINQEDAAKVAQNAAVTEVSGTEPATTAAAPTTSLKPMLRPESTPAGQISSQFGPNYTGPSPSALFDTKTFGGVGPVGSFKSSYPDGTPAPNTLLNYITQEGYNPTSSLGLDPAPMPQQTDSRRAIPTGRGINMTVEKPPSVPAAQIPYTTTQPISVPSSTPDPVIPEDTPATGQVPLAQAGALDDMIARAPVRTSAFTGEVGNQYAFDSSRANDAKLATEADDAGRFDQAAQTPAVTQIDQRDPYRDDVIIPQESKDYLDALNIDTSSPAKTKQMSDNYLRNRGDLVAPVYTGGGVERQDAANYLPASAVTQQPATVLPDPTPDPRDIYSRGDAPTNIQNTGVTYGAPATKNQFETRSVDYPTQSFGSMGTYDGLTIPQSTRTAGEFLGNQTKQAFGDTSYIDPTTPDYFRDEMEGFEKGDVTGFLETPAQARAREAAAQRARIQTRNKEIATATSKIPAYIANSKETQDAIKAGYVGSTTGGYAIGKISGSDGNEAGVVQRADGKVTKVRDLDPNATGQRAAMTVFSDAEGTRYTKSTFGKKTKLNGDKYEGPGITQQDKGGTPATATAKQVTKNGVRYNTSDGSGGTPSKPADPPGNTGGFTSITDMFDGGGPGESAQEEIDRGGGDGGSSRVICTELYKQGKLDRELYRMDVVYTAKHLSPITVRGYHYWAVPMVVKMRSSTLLTNVFEYLTIARAKEIAHIVKPQEYKKRSVLGYLIKNVGEAICYSIGLFTDQKDWTVLYNKGIVK